MRQYSTASQASAAERQTGGLDVKPLPACSSPVSAWQVVTVAMQETSASHATVVHCTGGATHALHSDRPVTSAYLAGGHAAHSPPSKLAFGWYVPVAHSLHPVSTVPPLVFWWVPAGQRGGGGGGDGGG